MGIFGLPGLDITSLLGGGSSNPFGGSGTSSGNADWIKNLIAPAFGEIKQGTATAADLTRQGYESQFRARLGGLTGGYNDQASRLGAQGASQGLSGDVIQRMLTGQGSDFLSQVGQAHGEMQSGEDFDLAKLMKGTGSELAGLDLNQAAIMSNYLATLKGAKATQQSGLIGGIGALLGGIL